MKHSFLILATLTVLCSCSKDNSGKKSSDPKVAKVQVVCDVNNMSQDILDNYDITYDYTDFTGAKHSEKLYGTTTVTFSIDNPSLSKENSTPFTFAITVTPKTPVEKEQYDATHSIKVGVNGYYADGSLITGSMDDGSWPCMSKSATGMVNRKYFDQTCTEIATSSATYYLWFCQTTSGEWHIGFEQAK